jgi:hypothetical protein
MWNLKYYIKEILKAEKTLKLHSSLNQKKGLVLRHDVDLSLDMALDMAKAEYRNNINSTYHVLISSDTYNILSKASKNILQQIKKMNFEIGLHFDCSAYRKKNIISEFKKERSLLEDIIESKILSYSFHAPSIYGYPKILINNLINAYNRNLFNNNYFSDSVFNIHNIDIKKVVKKSNTELVCLLIHPEHFVFNVPKYRPIMKKIISNFYKKIKKDFLINKVFKSEKINFRIK